MNRKIEEAYTFDDVLLIPAKAEFHPNEVDTSAILTNRISLNIPLISAPMDTVTEANLAIALAQEGGIGIIHKNLSILDQSEEVDKVKRAVSGMIVDPITMSPDQLVTDALALMRRYNISGIPIIEGGKLVGILTNRDLRFITDTAISVSKVMTTKKLITVPVGTTLEQSKELLHANKIEKLPVVDNANHLKGLITIKDIEKGKKFPAAAKDSMGRLLVGAAVGIAKDTFERVDALVKADADLIVVDTAHGHSHIVLQVIAEIRKQYPAIQLVGGNVATAEATEALIDAGVDAVKVGIGPGSICTTRIVAGVGVPQLTAILQCSEAAKKRNIPIIADGGIKHSGDITKALAAGAASVMIGSLFAGVEESPGEKVLYQGRTYKEYRGMGSIGAMAKGGKDRYFQENEADQIKLVPEGIEGRVPYKGLMSLSVHQMIGGVKAGMGYCGCQTISELHKKSKFVRITRSGLLESHVHDVIITKEAPNYHIG